MKNRLVVVGTQWGDEGKGKITDYFAQQADVVLMGVCPELKNNTEAATSRLIYMAIGDVLYTRLTLLRSKQYQDNLKSIRSSLALLRT